MTDQPTIAQLQDAIRDASRETLRIALAAVMDLHQRDPYLGRCTWCQSRCDLQGRLKCETRLGADLRAIASVLASADEPTIDTGLEHR